MTPSRVEGRAPAKVNLYLHVTGRRVDGYHELDSLVVFADICDMLYVERSSTLTLTVDGPFAGGLGGAGDENLVMRAARLLRDRFRVTAGASMRLVKALPVAAGIGGGSADAALALRLLCRLWDVDPEKEDLDELAAGLGADVPVCLAGQPARLQGIGERVTPVAIPPGAWLVLANPGKPLATPAVFGAFDGVFSSAAPMAELPDVDHWARNLCRLTNDLQRPAISLVPEITPLLEDLAAQPGCLLARMSGSGATCFGLFAEERAARRAAQALEAGSGIWARAGAVLESPEDI